MVCVTELLDLLIDGSPAEQKLASEQLTEIANRTSPPPAPIAKGDLIETYKAGDYVARLYGYHGSFIIENVSNPARKLVSDRGQSLISQPEFASRYEKTPKGDINLQSKCYLHSATLVIEHKNGSQTARKVSHFRGRYSYKDCRSDKTITREEFIKSLPAPFASIAEEITFHLEVESLPNFSK